jgi:hypothetical protein
MSTLLRDLLSRTLVGAPGVHVDFVEGDAEAVRGAVTRLEPDWLILELGEAGGMREVLELFDARPRVKMLALADSGARSLLCVQLGQLSPPTLLQALERIDRSGCLDVTG